MEIKSGIFDKSRLLANILLLILVAGNIFFSIQYTQNVKLQAAQEQKVSDESVGRLQTARFLKSFIDIVLNTTGTISFEDRVKLENDVRQLHNPAITTQWDAFVASADSASAQANAVKLMSMLTATLI